MTHKAPRIESFMVSHPHTIGRDQPLAHAHAMMREHGFRHLPVLDAGQVVGVISSRDLYFIETLRDVDATQVTVEEAMTAPVYTVSRNALLEDVCRTMAQHAYGCALVTDGTKLCGIFTTIDALRALADEVAAARAKGAA